MNNNLSPPCWNLNAIYSEGLICLENKTVVPMVIIDVNIFAKFGFSKSFNKEVYSYIESPDESTYCNTKTGLNKFNVFLSVL